MISRDEANQKTEDEDEDEGDEQEEKMKQTPLIQH
jgi:hypothetical protein